MATFNYKLRDSKSTKPTTINYYISLGRGCRLRGATQYSILPKFWNNDNQEVRHIAEVSKKRVEINKWLREFKKWIEDEIDNLKKTHLTNDKLKEALKVSIDIKLEKVIIKEKEVLTFYPFVEKFTELSKGRIIEKTGKPISLRTILDYKTVLKHIRAFDKQEDYKVTFESINLDFYYAFKDYLENEVNDYSLNTIGKYIKILKVFMNEATEQSLTTNYAYKSKYFVKPSERSIQIYLNEKELEKIIELDLTENTQLEQARDLFILASYTGLRYSDFSRLTKENIHIHKGVKVFRLHQGKTDGYLPIPIHPFVENILKRRNGNPPEKMPSQKINDYLTIIGEKAELTKIIIVNTTKGGKKITKMIPQNKMIKNHTGRRSFCTNAYLSGMNTLDIMAISGHNSEKTFLNYIKVSKDERAIKIADTAFFKPKSNLKVI
jgi:integrase